MRMIYNGIDMEVLELVEAVIEPVYDSSQTDLLYCRYVVSANVMINGQAEVRAVAGPPLSYTKTGGDLNHYVMQTRDKPTGTVAPVFPFRDSPSDVNVTVGRTSVNVTSGTNPVGTGVGGGSAVPPDRGTFTGAAAATPAGVHAFKDRRQVEIIPGPGPTAITHQLLYSRLTEPRAMLFLFHGTGGGSNLILASHGFDEFCDCRNGPIPNVLHITRAFGDGSTYFANFQVQTFVDLRQYPEGEAVPGLISNRFATTHTVDEDGILQIDVHGEAHFKANFLYKNAVSPDQFRTALFLPPPFGCVRGNIQVQGMENACGVRYSYTDRELPIHFVAGHFVDATQIEAVHRQALGSSTDVLTSALAAYERNLNLRVNKKWASSDPAPRGDLGRGGPKRPGRLPPPPEDPDSRPPVTRGW